MEGHGEGPNPQAFKELFEKLSFVFALPPWLPMAPMLKVL